MDAPQKVSLEALIYDNFRCADWSFYQSLKIECVLKGEDIHKVLKWAFGTNYKSIHVNNLYIEWEILHPDLARFPYADDKRIAFLIEQYKAWGEE